MLLFLDFNTSARYATIIGKKKKEYSHTSFVEAFSNLYAQVLP